MSHYHWNLEMQYILLHFEHFPSSNVPFLYFKLTRSLHMFFSHRTMGLPLGSFVILFESTIMVNPGRPDSIMIPHLEKLLKVTILYFGGQIQEFHPFIPSFPGIFRQHLKDHSF